MRKYFFTLPILLMVLFGCRNSEPNVKSNITVSLHPHKYLVDKISGNLFDVEVLVPPGADHETYDPTPAQFARISSSSLYFANGHLSFEEAWLPNIRSNNPLLKIVDLSEGIELIEGDGHMHGDHHHATADPHFWLSASGIKVMATNVYRALCTSFPENEAGFTANYKMLNQSLDSLNLAITNKLLPYEGQSFMIFHPALTYFAADYNMHQVAIEVDGKAPSLKGLQKFIDIAKQENIKVVLIQAQYDKENAINIAKEANAKVVSFDPVAYDWIKNMSEISDVIASSLKQ
ncbi:MAG: zinc ABC transporter substrate-binding protein [Bacteroidales bacterium]|nr:zinc ABC transporter substrate-binding protein [Bacteroidales bacterium]